MANTSVMPVEEKRLPYLYEQSSQFQRWKFTPDQLLNIRKRLNEKAKGKFNSTIEKELEARKIKNEELTKLGQIDKLYSMEMKDNYLSLEEEKQLLLFFQNNIVGLCKKLGFSKKVQLTAVVYFKRVCLKMDLLEYSLPNIMLTCLYLSTKTESSFISIKNFTNRIPKTSSSIILELEFKLCQLLTFDLQIQHPHRPLYGIMLELIALSNDSESIKKIYDQAIILLDKVYWGDIILVAMPNQIAMAIMKVICNDFHFKFDIYLEKTFSSDHLSTVNSIINVLIDKFIKPESIISRFPVDRIKEIDRKLILARDPTKNAQSVMYIEKPKSTTPANQTPTQ